MSDASEPARGGTEAPATQPASAGPEATDGDSDTLALPPTTADRVPTASSPIEEYPVPPGVPVPFAAPPTERDRGHFATRLVLGIVGGVGVAAAVIVALFLSSLVFVNSLYGQMKETALDFMDDVAAGDWDAAHDRLCPRLQLDPVESYIDEWEAWGAGGAQIVSFTETAAGGRVGVELDDGSRVALEMVIEQPGEDPLTPVCGWD